MDIKKLVAQAESELEQERHLEAVAQVKAHLRTRKIGFWSRIFKWRFRLIVEPRDIPVVPRPSYRVFTLGGLCVVEYRGNREKAYEEFLKDCKSAEASRIAELQNIPANVREYGVRFTRSTQC